MAPQKRCRNRRTAASGGAAAPPRPGAIAAQPAFIRGVLLLHSFEYDDAIAAFREAQKADPSFAKAPRSATTALRGTPSATS